MFQLWTPGLCSRELLLDQSFGAFVNGFVLTLAHKNRENQAEHRLKSISRVIQEEARPPGRSKNVPSMQTVEQVRDVLEICSS